MERIIEGKWVLFTKHILNSPMEIGKHASQDEPILRSLAAKHALEIIGPLEHAYWNMSIPGVPHILEIWLHVQAKEINQTRNLKYGGFSPPSLRRTPPGQRKTKNPMHRVP
jgi:hypothetical protein